MSASSPTGTIVHPDDRRSVAWRWAPVEIRASVKSGANKVLSHLGLRLVSEREVPGGDGGYRRIAAQYACALASTVLPEVALTQPLLDRLAELVGTDVGEAMFLLDLLNRSLTVPGDICEFGVAQGATSALIAERIRDDSTRRLWLYDSFEGLPDPSGRDRLIDDPLGLGHIWRYAGKMANGEELVISRLDHIRFPRTRVEIVKAFVTRDLDPCRLPDQVCFAYVDFDFYEGTRDVLELLHSRLSTGAWILVDDFGYLSSGVEEAVLEFLDRHPTSYETHIGPDYAGHFLMLHKGGGTDR